MYIPFAFLQNPQTPLQDPLGMPVEIVCILHILIKFLCNVAPQAPEM